MLLDNQGRERVCAESVWGWTLNRGTALSIREVWTGLARTDTDERFDPANGLQRGK